MIKRNKIKGDTLSEHIHHRKRFFTVRNAKHLIAMKHLHDLFLKLNILKYDQTLNEFENNSAKSSSRISSTRNIICSYTPLDELFNKNNDMINKQPISKETINNLIYHSK